MNLDQLNVRGGFTIRESIDSWVFDMQHEFADLDMVAGYARGAFGLRGEDVVEFARRSIHAMLDAGGVIMDRTQNEDYPLFLPTACFGTTRDAITEAVIAEWRARGGIEGPIGWGEYAFAMPDDHP